jgi:hypothetical protein
MSDLLRTAVFRPLVKAMASSKWLTWLPRKEIATLCTFGMSGLLHGYPYLLLRGGSHFTSVMLFFLLQVCSTYHIYVQGSC